MGWAPRAARGQGLLVWVLAAGLVGRVLVVVAAAAAPVVRAEAGPRAEGRASLAAAGLSAADRFEVQKFPRVRLGKTRNLFGTTEKQLLDTWLDIRGCGPLLSDGGGLCSPAHCSEFL